MKSQQNINNNGKDSRRKSDISIKFKRRNLNKSISMFSTLAVFFVLRLRVAKPFIRPSWKCRWVFSALWWYDGHLHQTKIAFSFHFYSRSLFSITCEPGIGERRYLNESESFIVFLSSFIVNAWYRLIDESTRE